MWTRLLALELVRIVLRWRYWALVAVNAALVIFGILQCKTVSFMGTPTTAGIAFATGFPGISLMSIMAPFALGDEFAKDRGSRLTVLQTVRGASRITHVTTRAAAIALAAFAATALCATIGLVVSGLSFPLESGQPSEAVAFMPGLLEQSMIVYGALLAGLHGLAVTAIGCVTLAVGALARRTYASVLVPLALIGLGLLMPAVSFNPLERVMFANTRGVEWTAPWSMVGYWGAILVVALAVGVVRTVTGDEG